jgi:DNA-binding CsgD family transcriptional regulator
MKSAPSVRHGVDALLSAQMLVEIILQLPAGLICADLEGTILFMNATAKELLQSIWLAGEHEDHEKKPLLLELPFEIREGIRYFTGLLTQEDNTYSKPFPRLYFQIQGCYELEFLICCPFEELNGETRKEARIITLLKSAKSLLQTQVVAKRFSLTNREKEVLHLLLKGKIRKEIAAEMNLSEETVRSYFRTLYEKLGVTNRVEAATLALRMELLENLKSVLQIQG